jgi:hypothetical protein
MEVQLTAEENAAFSLFIHFLTRVLHEEKKNKSVHPDESSKIKF